MISLIYLLLAIFGLSFLIFIHELGHYWMARRVGMRVETFAIGFGKPIYKWKRDGVDWQIGWLPFGGYVKIAGYDASDGVDPYEIKDGFFGKKPWDRIKVAAMGPLVNIFFAFLVFTLLWAIGGRVKEFSDFTHKIGSIDPKSELYAQGIRPGDEITEYNDYKFLTKMDHLFAPILADGDLTVKGVKVDQISEKRAPFEYTVSPYPHPRAISSSSGDRIVTVGIFDPAKYMIYDRFPGGKENPLMEGSPLKGSGIQYGDRLLWVDGELVMSDVQFSEVINDNRVLMTIKRGEKTILRRVPRIRTQELRPNLEFREELLDWQFEAGLTSKRFADTYAIPYNLSYDCVVENGLRFIDQADETEAFPKNPYSEVDEPLMPGDIILAVQGVPVSRSYEILKEVQEKRLNIIVQRDSEARELQSWKEADLTFNQNIHWDHLSKMAKSIGSEKQIMSIGKLHLLEPIKPKMRMEFPMSDEARAQLTSWRLAKKKEIEAIENTEERNFRLRQLENEAKTLIIGLPNPQDRKVVYNPEPSELFSNVTRDIWRTLSALFTGVIGPKNVAGPVGIISVVHETSMVSYRESIFWIAAISLNLGFLNLLPIPILDGGTIVFSFFEMITGRRMKPKTLEKIVAIFAVLLISFFVFLTYNDIVRVFGRFLQ